MAKVDGASLEVGHQAFAYLVVSSSMPALPELTPAERDVVRMVYEGCANKEIATRRNTSVNTISNQLASIFAALGVASRFELVELVSRLAPRPEGQ